MVPDSPSPPPTHVLMVLLFPRILCVFQEHLTVATETDSIYILNSVYDVITTDKPPME